MFITVVGFVFKFIYFWKKIKIILRIIYSEHTNLIYFLNFTTIQGVKKLKKFQDIF